MNKWISVNDRLPEEHDSIFAKFYGTDKWDSAMTRVLSNEVNVVIQFEDGTKKVTTLQTYDGKWKQSKIVKYEVTHWMPLPEPPMEEVECKKNVLI